jgi:hypothetical protein
LALEESLTEDFSALQIAQRAGAIVTHLDGREVTFEENIGKQYFNTNERYFTVCSANDVLHEQILKELAKINRQDHSHYRKILEENRRIRNGSYTELWGGQNPSKSDCECPKILFGYT